MLALIAGLALIDDRRCATRCAISCHDAQRRQYECENGKYCRHGVLGAVG
jgi:hypothetical protein